MRLLRPGVRMVLALSASLLTALRPAAAEVYVVSVGDGVSALTGNSTAAVIQKFSDGGGTPLSTITLPTAAGGGNQPFSISGNATSEGYLALSPNNQFLTMGGYATAPGVGSVAGTASTTVPRAVARYDLASSTLSTNTVFSGDSTFSAGNIRSAASYDGGQFWMTGSNQGVRSAANAGTTSTLISSTGTNTRVAKIFDGQLYVSSAVSPIAGINSVGAGLPTGTGQTTTTLFATGGSPYDFYRRDANTFYVADDRAATSGGGIQKWVNNAGSWQLSYTIPMGTSGLGARGLAGSVVNGTTVLYATSAANANQLFAVRDTGMGVTASAIADAGPNRAFRGVSFVAPTQYRFTTIDVPGASVTSVANVDNAGRVVGSYDDGSGTHAFIWENGVFTTFDVPNSAGVSSANGINAANQVVGYYRAPFSFNAYIRNGGVYTDLVPFAGAPETAAYSINAAGHVVGFYKQPSDSFNRGFFFDGTNYTTVHPPSGAVGTEANGINNSDEVVGYYADGVRPHGFHFANGVYTTVDHPLGPLGTVAQGINDAGDIAGIYFDGTDKDHGFVKTSAGYTTVDFPGSLFSGLVGINNSGQVAGYYRDASGFHGYLATPVAAADFNADGLVDGSDFNTWQGGFGIPAGSSKSTGNADGDADTDGADFLKWQTQLAFTAAASPASTGVPEPVATALAAIGVLGPALLRRRAA